MEIVKQNETYNITDTTEKYSVNGTVNIDVSKSNSVQMSFISVEDSSKYANYNRTLNKIGEVSVNYYTSDKAIEADILQYIADNLNTILEQVSK